MKNVDEKVKNYLISQYEIYYFEYGIALDEEKRHDALKHMKDLSILLYEKFGIDTKDLKLMWCITLNYVVMYYVLLVICSVPEFV